MKLVMATAAIAILALAIPMSGQTAPGEATGMFHHDIFITLKDKSPAAVERQLEFGRKYLTNNPGEISFSATVLAEGLTRHQQVSYLHNDTDFSVAFHLVFADAKSHNDFQVSEHHVKHFIPLSNPNWKQIRVFDSEIK